MSFKPRTTRPSAAPTIETLEGRQLLSVTVPSMQAASRDAGATPDTAVDLGTISKKKTISKQETIGKADTTDVFKFTTTRAVDLQLKVSGKSAKPKLLVENTAFEDAFGGTKSSAKLRVSEGTYFVTVTSSAKKSGKYKLQVKANPTTKAPTFEDGQNGGTFTGTLKPLVTGDPNADIRDSIHQWTFTATQTGDFKLPAVFTGGIVAFQATPFGAGSLDPNLGGGGGTSLDLAENGNAFSIKTVAGQKYVVNLVMGGNDAPASYSLTFDPSFSKVKRDFNTNG